MTSLFHFLGLDINQQAEYVWQGIYLTSRTDNDLQVLLYNLGEFYAEVFFDPRNTKITYIKGFKATSHLVPYVLLPNTNQKDNPK